MKTLTIAKTLCLSLLCSAAVLSKMCEGEALHALSHDIMVMTKTNETLRARVIECLKRSDLLDLPAAEITRKIKDLRDEDLSKIIRTLDDKDRSAIIAKKFHELLNPTTTNKHYSIEHYADTMKLLCEETDNEHFTKDHSQFTKQLGTCAHQVVKRGLIYLISSFKGDLGRAFETLKDKTTKRLLNETLAAEIKKQGQGGLIRVLHARASGTR